MKAPIFIHNPKAASTSVRNAIPAVKSPRDRTIHLSIRHPEVRKQIADNEDRWVFMITRHPLDRFVSAFYYFKQPMKRSVQEFSMLEAVITNADINDFVKGCDLLKMARVCPHFERQKWFQRGGKVNQFLRFETLGEDWSLLCENLGIDEVKLGRKRTSRHRTWQEELNQKSVDKLTQFYMRDFELFYTDELEQ